MAEQFSASELREIQGLTTSINKGMAELAAQSDKRNKKLEREVDLTKEILKNINSEEEGLKAIKRIQDQIVNVSSMDFGINRNLGREYQFQLDLAQQELAVRLKQIGVINSVKDASDGVGESMKNSLASVQRMIGDIPVIGGLLSNLSKGGFEKMNAVLDRGVRGFNVGFERGFRNVTNQGGSFTKALSGGLKRGFSTGIGSAAKLAKALMGPQVIIAAIAAGLALGFARFSAIQDAAKKFREETGLLNSQTQGLVSNIQTVSRDMAGIGASAEDVASAASAFTKEFDNLQQPSKGVLTSMVGMEKSFGVSAANQAKVNEQFQRMAGVSAETAQSMIQTTVQAAKLAGVAPAQVMADIADNSEAAYKYFNGSPKALAKAAVEAAKLGTSIGQASDLSSKLLDFESSISSELNASAMLGTNINFNEARRLAASKDIIGAQQAVVKEVSKLGDLTKLSVFEQEALAEAAGMPIGDLIKQQQIRERLGDATEDQLAAANKLLDSGMEMKDITDEQLAQEAQRISQQNEMQSQNDKLKNSLSALGTGFADVFMPVINFVMPLINDLIDMVSSVLMPVFKILGNVFKITFGILSAVIQPIFAVFKALVAAVAEPFDRIGDALQPLGDKFAELKDKVMPFIEPLIGIFTSIGNILGNIVGGAVGLVVDLLMFLFDTAFSIFSSIAGFVNTYLIEPIMSFVNGIGNVLGSIGSFFGLGGDSATEAATQSAGPTESAVTAVGPDVALAEGGIVTGPTNALIGEAGPEAVLPLNEMYTKFDEMIAAFRETKDVYMDGKKVTSGVNRVVDSVGTNSYSLG
jgi:phage-related protein